MTVGLALRDADPVDAPAIAGLHAASWRSAYRGILSDAFLDGPVEAERLKLWSERLAAARPDVLTILCWRGGALLGFGCLFVDEDPRWGSFVSNLHAAPDSRGLGVGRLLMRAMAARAAPGRPIHLFCLEANGPGRSFYDRLGGTIVERCPIDEPDGRVHPSLRYGWPTPAALAAACG